MPLSIRGHEYLLPKEAGSPGPTGDELIAIENVFQVDGLALLALLGDSKPSPYPGVTRTKALYAVAWIAMHRVDPEVDLPAMLTDLSIDEITLVEPDENPTQVASSEEAPPA